MNRINIYARSVGIALAVALTATPAFAGGEDRAKVAIASAQAKIDAANKLGANAETPRLAAEAEAALRSARESLARDKNAQAIEQANHAAMLADTALGQAQRSKENRESALRAESESREAALRADSERAQAARRADAERAAAAAQDAAAAANARASAAEAAAAAASADAAAARATPPVVIQQPAETTVTTETVKTAAPAAKTTTKTTVKRPAVRKPAPKVATATPRPSTEKTTTTVTTRSN